MRYYGKKKGDECEACGSKFELTMDHDHSCCPRVKGKGSYACGKCTRGTLCRDCNLALGLLQDSPARLKKLIKYLKKYGAE